MSYAEVNGQSLYFEEHGSGAGEALVLLHGGLGSGDMFTSLLPSLTKDRRVVLVDLQGHGRSHDTDRPLRPELLADDVAALLKHLGLDRADVLGYSLGAEVALRIAFQHPDAVRRLVLISVPFKRDGWFPEVVAGMDQMSAAAAEMMKGSPPYTHYAEVAPVPANWTVLVGKTAELLQTDFDWTEEAAALAMPVLLVYGDADSIRPAHVAEFYALLGGGLKDAGWDNSQRPTSRLAVLAGASHYDILDSPALIPTVLPFLASPTH
ncbi:alpha/beta hydrolase [Streptomyces sp. G-G2]|uniref:alpha/beta fold hydrolase n=1 Tax=Streptomyces sp. G-G2 TaxID=3046201 RepID=UPI0024B9F4A6|nr:alpha/beta hydrolase [Streptomyces sp. G-G2]MDJ0381001.1 alpha/beta hydrolase [Streptomyces sp. G-G2]